MKDKILDKIRRNRPEAEVAIFIPSNACCAPDCINSFTSTVENIGATIVRCSNDNEIIGEIKARHPNAKRIINTIPSLDMDSLEISSIPDAKALHPLDLSIVQGDFGVVENGAIWINHASLPMRAIPFIAEHLVILLSEDNIVSDMHEAYARLEEDTADYGVFIAGPSKTADIEQCLVVGAQGAKSLLVILI